MIIRFTIVFLLLFLNACSSAKYNYTPQKKLFSIPKLGAQVSAGLGEPLLDQGVSIERDIFQITSESSIVAYKVKPGKLVKIGEDAEIVYFSQDISSGYSIYSGLIVSSPDPTVTVMYKKKTNQYCIMRPADLTVCGEINGIHKKETIMTSESFRRTLIYSGRVDNKLRISYREYSNDLARSAFNTDVEYDLGESNIIGYAGARLEVIKATNTEILYKVIRNFNTNN